MKTRIFAFVFYVVCGFLPFFAYAQTNASGLFLRPSQGSFFVGSTFDVSIVLDTKGAAINTVEVELLFPSDILQVASPSTGYSIVQVWASPPLFSNKEGKVYFVGGIPSPGIETSNGIVLTMTFRAIAPGEAKIEFGPQTKVLANDALGHFLNFQFLLRKGRKFLLQAILTNWYGTKTQTRFLFGQKVLFPEVLVI